MSLIEPEIMASYALKWGHTMNDETSGPDKSLQDLENFLEYIHSSTGENRKSSASKKDQQYPTHHVGDSYPPRR